MASTLTLGTATLRYFFPNVLFEPPSQFEAGFPNTLHDGEVDEEFKSSQRVWLVRDGSEIYALLAICTHLGCTPNWFEDAQIFKCPCQQWLLQIRYQLRGPDATALGAGCHQPGQ